MVEPEPRNQPRTCCSRQGVLNLALTPKGRVDASYPPQSLKGAVELLLAGSPTPTAFAAKLAFLQYSLQDLGLPSVCDAFRCIPALLQHW